MFVPAIPDTGHDVLRGRIMGSKRVGDHHGDIMQRGAGTGFVLSRPLFMKNHARWKKTVTSGFFNAAELFVANFINDSIEIKTLVF